MNDNNQINVFVVNTYTGSNSMKSYSDGITLGELFDLEMRNEQFSRYTVRLNRATTTNVSQRLREGDRVSITPSKVDAGC